MVKPIYYMQTDPKWKNHNYSAPGEKKTIGSSGCGVACSAMVIASLKNKAITPVHTAEWSMAHGYKALNQGTYYTYFVPQFNEYGIKCKRLNTTNLYGKSSSVYHDEALKALKNNDWLICCMGKGHWTKTGHFIIVYGYKDGYVYINDPASKAADRIKNTWSLLSSQIKYMWTVTVPENLKKDNEIIDNNSHKGDGNMRGIDTSKWQNGNVNFLEAKKSGYEFVFLRIGYNQTKDPFFESDYAEAKRAGLKVGGYFYATSLTEQGAVEDANRVLKWIKNKEFDMPLAYDMEEQKMKMSSRKDANSKQFNAFADIVRKNGFVPMLYTGSSMFNSYFNKSLINDHLWIAKYGKNDGQNHGCPNVGKQIAIHQYTSAAISNDFYKAKLDRNQMMIGYEDLMKKVNAPSKPVTPQKPPVNNLNPNREIVRAGQVHANNFVQAGLVADGIWGAKTKKAAVKVLQHALNLDYGKSINVDGIWGIKSNEKLGRHYVKRGEKQYMVTALEILLMLRGYDCNGVELPGRFGVGLYECVKQYQKDKGLPQTGKADAETFKSLIS